MISSGEAMRCAWAQTPLSIAYHDSEWGRAVHDDSVLFEFLMLEGGKPASAGRRFSRSARTIARRSRIASGEDRAYSDKRVARLKNDAGIICNRLKVACAVTNARAFEAVQRFGRFDRFVWWFVGGKPE